MGWTLTIRNRNRMSGNRKGHAWKFQESLLKKQADFPQTMLERTPV